MNLRCKIFGHKWNKLTEKNEVDYAVHSLHTSPYPTHSDWYEYEAKCSRCGLEDTLVDEVFTDTHPAVTDPYSVGRSGYTNTVRKPPKP